MRIYGRDVKSVRLIVCKTSEILRLMLRVCKTSEMLITYLCDLDLVQVLGHVRFAVPQIGLHHVKVGNDGIDDGQEPGKHNDSVIWKRSTLSLLTTLKCRHTSSQRTVFALLPYPNSHHTSRQSWTKVKKENQNRLQSRICHCSILVNSNRVMCGQ